MNTNDTNDTNNSVTENSTSRDNSKHRRGVSISIKILAVTLGTTIVVLLASGIVSFFMSRDAIEVKILDQLTSAREIKGQQIESYVDTISKQVVTFSENPTIIDAMSRFRSAFYLVGKKAETPEMHDEVMESGLLTYYRDEFFTRLRPNTADKLAGVSPSDFIPAKPGAAHLQNLFITDNPHPTGMKHKLDAVDKSLYSKLHEKLHPTVRSYLEKFGYYDIFLVDHNTGDIVYSVFKEVDYATSLITGPYKDTNFARAFKAAAISNDKDFVKLVDFEPYYPSYNAPASFIASPIFDGHRKVGVLVFQMPIDRINDIMTSNHGWKNVGLGESGETYLVGEDFTMRTQSRFLIEDSKSFLGILRNIEIPDRIVDLMESFGTSIGLLPVKTEGTKAALDGQADTAAFPGYRGVNVFSSYRPLIIEDVSWAIMAEMEESEAFAPVNKLKDRFILGGSILIAIAIYIAFFFSKSMTATLQVLLTRAEALARGELDQPIPVESSDEIGQLAYGFEGMRLSIRKLVDDLQEEKDALERRVSERTEKLDTALHKQEEQTQVLEQRNIEMLEIQEDLKQSEKEQVANKERIDSILQASPDGVCVIDAEGTVTMVNHSLQEVFGYSSEEVVGMNVKILMPDDLADQHHNALERVVWGREPKLIGKGAVEVRGRNKSGDIFPMELSISQIGTGKDSIFVGIIRNITERKKAERELADKEAQLRLAFDNMPAGIKFIDKDLKIIAFNQQYLEVMGYPDDLIQLGRSSLDELRYQAERGDLGPGNPVELVEQTLAKHGSEETKLFEREVTNGRYAAITVKNTSDGQRVTVVHDITEQKKAEKKIVDQLLFTESLLDAVPNPIFVKDTDLRYTAFNRAYEEAFGMRREEYIGKTVLEADYLVEDHEAYHQADKKLIEKGGFTREEYTARFSDDLDHELLYWRSTFNLADGAPGGMLGILIDISDRKEMEREMVVAMEQAETANKTKSAFLANMSHELRTPMNAIIGYAEILKEDAEDEENEVIVPDLDKIITAGRHLLQLINDVLDISKVESGHMELYLEEFDIAAMISDAASTVSTLVEKNNNTLEIKVEENIGSMHADMTKVRQIVFNLVSNAAKFTSDGKVGIEASTMDKNGEPFIRLAVTDSGIGIPEDKLEHIFEEFSQADTSTTRNYGGTGLGLALVLRFARMMGGDVRVESTPGEGSVFTLEIPARVVVEDETSASVLKGVGQAVKSGAVTPGKILVIDDDSNARRLLTRVLEDQGYEVITAEGGEEGIALAKSEKPAVITCDILMPNIDGWEVLQRLKGDPDTASIPVVMVSMVDEGKKGAALGAVEHLRKPVDREQLRKVISRYIKTTGKVLVVEDDLAVQEVISKALGSMGVEAIVADNGQVALNLLEDQWPDVILLDLMMPVMDGFEFLSHYRKLEGSEKVPVIVVTAKDLTAADRDELEGHVSEIFTKEEDYIEDLIQSIGGIVSSPNKEAGEDVDR